MAASRPSTSRPGSPWRSTSSTSARWAVRPCRARTGPTSRSPTGRWCGTSAPRCRCAPTGTPSKGLGSASWQRRRTSTPTAFARPAPFLPVPSRCSARTSPTRPRSPARSCRNWPATSRQDRRRPSTQPSRSSAGSPPMAGSRYSTQIEGGSDEDALATFLEERVGYCEQFAATMALMARSVGIPARVVVGFTQGRLEGNQWVVRGTDAHAWPELWMGSAGWVRFEPTPGAPTTTTPAYTPPPQSTAGPTLRRPSRFRAVVRTTAPRAPPRCPTRSRPVRSAGHRPLRALPVRWILIVLAVTGPAPASRSCSPRSPSAPPAFR